MNAAGELEVIVLRGKKLVHSLSLTDREITVGRSDQSLVHLDGVGVSAEHAIIHFTGRTCLIEELDGSSGIFLKGERIASHMVQPNDELTIGEFTLRFVVHKASAEAPARVARAERAVPAEDKTQVVSMASLRSSAPSRDDQTLVSTPAPPQAAAAKALTRDEVVTKVVKVAERPRPAPEPAKAAPLKVAPTPLAKGASLQAAQVKPAPASDSSPGDDFADDDDEHEDANFEPSFSLVSALTTPRRQAAGPELIGEAVVYLDERVLSVNYVTRGHKTRLSRHMELVHTKGGELKVASRDNINARVYQGRRLVDSPTITEGKAHLLVVPEDGTAMLEIDRGRKVFLRLCEPLEAAPRAKKSPPLTAMQWAVLGASILFHLVAFVLVAFLSADRYAVEDINAGRFAQIDLKDLELEAPKPVPKVETKKEDPAPKPEPMPKTPAAPKKQPPQKKAPPVPSAAKSAPVAAAPTTPKPTSAASNLLSALGAPSQSNSTSAAAAATTNLDAVSAPKSGGFKVAGVIGKMAGDSLQMGSAGGAIGRIDTKSAAELSKNGKLGKVEGGGASGRVRGVVTEPPARSVEVQGSLDRSEIQKVVSAHLYEVQACYEHQLVRDPGLSGKVVAEWVIGVTGSVTTAKIKNSTVRSGEVSSCIQNAVKRWTFPKPQGGSVTVTFPFVFSTVGL